MSIKADAEAAHLRMPHLFDAFAQGSTGISRSHEGSSLGLSIIHRLVRMLGDTIDVESTPGMGSTFTITIPPYP